MSTEQDILEQGNNLQAQQRSEIDRLISHIRGDKKKGQNNDESFEGVYGVYDSDMANEIMAKIEKRYSSEAKTVGFESFEQKIDALRLISNILDDHYKAKKRNDNVIAQKEDIEKVDEVPWKINDTQGAYDEMGNRMGVGNTVRWHPEEKESYRPNFYQKNQPNSEKKEAIKNRTSKVEILAEPDSEYRRLVHLARLETSQELAREAARLEAAVNRGCDLTDAAKSEFRVHQDSSSDAFKGGLLKTAHGAHNFLEYAGRGIFSRIDPKKTEKWRSYVAKRNELLSNFVWEAFNKKGAVLKEGLENLEKMFRNGEISKEQYDGVKKIIEDEIAKKDGQEQEIIDNMNKISEKMYDTVKDHTKKEDDMWKFRILQLALLVTPFAGLNMLGPLSSILGSVFGSAGFAHGIASLATSQHTGVFGKIAEFFRINDLIYEILTNVPVIDQGVQLIDFAAQSPLGKALIEVGFMTVLAAPFSQFAVAFAYSGIRLDSEIKENNKYNNLFKRHEKGLKDTVKDMIGNNSKDLKGIKKIVTEQLKIYSNMYQDQVLADFISKLGAGRIEKLFGEEIIKDMQDKKILTDDKFGDKIDADLLQKALIDKDFSAKYQEQFLLLRSIARNNSDMSFDEVKNKFQTINNEKDNRSVLVQEEAQWINQSYILDLADKRNLGTVNKNILLHSKDNNIASVKEARKIATENFTKELIEIEVKHFSQSLGDGYSSPVSLKAPGSSPGKVGHLSALDNNPNLQPILVK